MAKWSPYPSTYRSQVDCAKVVARLSDHRNEFSASRHQPIAIPPRGAAPLGGAGRQPATIYDAGPAGPPPSRWYGQGPPPPCGCGWFVLGLSCPGVAPVLLVWSGPPPLWMWVVRVESVLPWCCPMFSLLLVWLGPTLMCVSPCCLHKC